jgi:two-component system cell cycle sensor histidine kinase/response regulator CckA
VKEILIVDDDELMRELVAEWLTADGYRARTATNGEMALELLREREAALIITDLHMPRLGGAEAVARMRHEHPDVPLIAMSGHFRSGRHVTPEVVLALGARLALAKPFSRQDLLQAVRDVLGPSQA